MKYPRRILLIIILIAAIIRLYHLGVVPQGLFGDEIDAGYNAYSLLHTLRDYNGNFLPAHTESMGDNRAALFIWSLTPTIAILGLSDFSVRLAPALWGLVSIYLIYEFIQVAHHQLKLKTNPHLIGLISAAMLAIAPWHIHFSRSAFEITFMISLLLAGTIFTLKAFTNSKYLYLATTIFALYGYSYHVAKLFSPLIVLTMLIIFYKQFQKIPLNTIIISALLYFAILTPLAIDVIAGAGNSRFSGLNIINTPTLEHDIVYARSQSPHNSLFSRIVHNKATYLTHIFIEQYATALSPEFIFVNGQIDNPRHSLPGFGLYPLWMIILYPLGIYVFIRNSDNPFFRFMIIWILLSPISSSLTINGARHITRLSVLFIPLTILLSYGFMQLYQLFPKQYQLKILITIFAISILSFANYTYQYYTNYSQTYYRWWNYGMGPATKYVIANQDKYDRIAFTRNYADLQFLYYAFYTEYPPSQLQAQWNQDITPDVGIENIEFKTLNAADALNSPRTLFIQHGQEIPEEWTYLESISSPDPQETSPIFNILQSPDMPNPISQ